MNNWYCNTAGQRAQCGTCAHSPPNMTAAQRSQRQPVAVTLSRNKPCPQFTEVIKGAK